MLKIEKKGGNVCNPKCRLILTAQQGYRKCSILQQIVLSDELRSELSKATTWIDECKSTEHQCHGHESIREGSVQYVTVGVDPIEFNVKSDEHNRERGAHRGEERQEEKDILRDTFRVENLLI